jgi:transposase
MVLPEQKYLNILDLVLNGVNYRDIGKLEQVSKNTISDSIKRLKTTGTIFPAINRKSKYDPIIQEVREKIQYFLQLQRTTYNKRHKINLKNEDIYRLLNSDGYNISRCKANELIRLEKNALRENYLHIVHPPGETVEFDWGQLKIQIGDNPHSTNVSFAVFTLPYSNYRKVYVSERSDSKAFVDALTKFTRELGGIPANLVIDNMKIAKIRLNNKGKFMLTKLFEDLTEHYKINVNFCTPYRPNQKGNVENAVRFIKEQLERAYINSFDNLSEIQDFVNTVLVMANSRSHPLKNDTCANLLKHEFKQFLELPKKDYVFYYEKYRKVYKNGMISFNHNKYSVPEALKGERVLIRYNEKLMYIIDKNSEIIAKYTLQKRKKHKLRKHRIWYMLNKLQNKSEGFVNSEEFRSITQYEKLLFDKVFKQKSNDFIAFIQLIRHKKRSILKRVVQKYYEILEDLTIDDLLTECLLD